MRESSHAVDKIWARVHFTARENLVTRHFDWQESSSMAKLGEEDLAQNAKAWLGLGASRNDSLEVLYGRHVSTSFLDLFSGHDEAGLSPNTKVFGC